MRNRYKGICSNCGVDVPPKQGRWKLIPKTTQNFTGLRCLPCSTTTKRNKKEMKAKGIVI